MTQTTAQTIAQMFTRPHRTQMPKTPKDYGMEFEAVTFPSLDGLTLSAWKIPAPKTYVPDVLPSNVTGFW